MKCLIIGGGYGGLAAAAGLAKAAAKQKQTVEIVLVEPKDYFEVAWASYRNLFDPVMADKCLFDLDAFCSSSKKNTITHKKTLVTALTETSATLANGESVDFDVCLVAVGAGNRWAATGRGPPAPGQDTMAGRKAAYAADGKALLDAPSVLIVGGGLIGTELAGDLAWYKKKANSSAPVKVTLVHSKEHLCPEMTPKAAAMVQRKLTKLGVTVLLNDKAEPSDDGATWTLKSTGKVLEANTVVTTMGNTPISSFLDSSWLNEQGWVEVDDNFKVKAAASGKIFCIGDCCTALPSAGVSILDNVTVLGHNLLVSLTQDGGKPLKKFVQGPAIVLATVGPKDGVASTPLGHTQFLLPTLKNKTMFLFRVKSDLGLK
jgi:NADH dehydrogenase FAD-containing subunit